MARPTLESHRIDREYPAVPKSVADIGHEESTASSVGASLDNEVWARLGDQLLEHPQIQGALRNRNSQPVRVLTGLSGPPVLHVVKRARDVPVAAIRRPSGKPDQVPREPSYSGHSFSLPLTDVGPLSRSRRRPGGSGRWFCRGPRGHSSRSAGEPPTLTRPCRLRRRRRCPAPPGWLSRRQPPWSGRGQVGDEDRIEGFDRAAPGGGGARDLRGHPRTSRCPRGSYWRTPTALCDWTKTVPDDVPKVARSVTGGSAIPAPLGDPRPYTDSYVGAPLSNARFVSYEGCGTACQCR